MQPSVQDRKSGKGGEFKQETGKKKKDSQERSSPAALSPSQRGVSLRGGGERWKKRTKSSL